MKKLASISPRLLITGAILLIEVIFFAILLNRFINYLPLVSSISFLISILIILYLVKTDETSSIKIAWILVITTIPVLGGVLYLMVGTRYPVRKMIAKTQKSHHEVSEFLEQNTENVSAIKDDNARFAGTVEHVMSASSYPVYTNTSSKYYSFGEDMYEDMLKELREAKEYIFLEYFIISDKSKMWNGILEILVEKAAEGVDVRLIYDDMGSVGLFTIKHLADIVSKKIKVIPFNPFVPTLAIKMNNRDHRKIMVIDGKTAFNGGINIADEYINLDDRLGVWKDTGVLLKGDAVKSFTLMFIETWNAFCVPNARITDLANYSNATISEQADGYILPYGDSPLDTELLGEDVYIDILNQAKDYVTIFTPYLIISDKMTYALQLASKRGVKVKILTPGVPDKKLVYRMTRSFYRDLLKDGVEIYEYTPGFLHAKSFLCDDDIAVVGTINLDYRSLYLHFECATMLYKASSISSLKDDTLKTIADSKQITLKDCKTGVLSELFDSILRVFAPLT